MVRGVSEGNLFWFLELIGALKLFRMVFTMCHVCLSGELLWRFDDLLHAHPQFGNILCGALLPSVMIESLRRRSANGERLSLRGEQCTAPVSSLCFEMLSGCLE